MPEVFQKGTLYLCPTPIGNLEDITYRTVRCLREADLIAAEDTRHTKQLLMAYDIDTPLTSYHEHNKAEKGPQLIEKLQDGQMIALVSDAGMPAICDPGSDMVRLALEADIPIVPLPGANAGLTGSSLPAWIRRGSPLSAFCRRRRNIACRPCSPSRPMREPSFFMKPLTVFGRSWVKCRKCWATEGLFSAGN